jgi:hypothetical protein
MNRQQVLELLSKEIERAGSQVKFARRHRLSPSYVHDVLVQRNIVLGQKMLDALGLERRVTYIRVRRRK